jgi:hypothetical protein
MSLPTSVHDLGHDPGLDHALFLVHREQDERVARLVRSNETVGAGPRKAVEVLHLHMSPLGAAFHGLVRHPVARVYASHYQERDPSKAGLSCLEETAVHPGKRRIPVRLPSDLVFSYPIHRLLQT